MRRYLSFILKHQIVLTFTLLLVVTIAVHSSYIANGFTWLDHIDIENRSAIVTDPGHVVPLFFRPYSSTHFYRPLISITHSLDFAIYKGNPYGFHFTNVLLHSLVTLLVFLILYYGFGKRTLPSVVGSLIVAAHPVTSLSVGQISYRTDPLAVFFTLAAFLLYIVYFKKKSFRYIILSAVCLFLALCTKETVLFWFPLLILVFSLTTDYSLFKLNNKVRIALLYVTVFIVYFYLRSTALSEAWQFAQAPLTVEQYIGTRLATFFRLIVYLLLPFTPPISDTVRISPLFSWESILGLLVIILISALIIVYRKNKKIVLSLGILVLSLLPGLNLLPLPRFISPHYLYFSIFGLALCVFSLTQYVMKRGRSLKKLSLIVLSSWLLIGTINTFQSGYRYKNDYTLFKSEYDKDPHFKEGLLYLAQYYASRDEIDTAILAYESILRKNDQVIAFSDPHAARINLAELYLQRKQLDKAERLLLTAFRQTAPKDRIPIVYNLALVKFEQGNYQDTIVLIEETRLHTILKPQAGLLLSDAYIHSNQKEKAKVLLEDIKPFAHNEMYSQIYGRLLKQVE